jgi:hypothetical protein
LVTIKEVSLTLGEIGQRIRELRIVSAFEFSEFAGASGA